MGPEQGEGARALRCCLEKWLVFLAGELSQADIFMGVAGVILGTQSYATKSLARFGLSWGRSLGVPQVLL